ncbi:MAG TPA: hypothetical protein VMV48_04555 [Gallionellaceae bacterium]|nr:hypothetical protein [Gallionellaceae bacterium]
MTTPDNLKDLFTQASGIVLQAFSSSNFQSGADPTPTQLIEAINQFIIIYEKLGSKYVENSVIKKDNISQIGEDAINCLNELGSWAERLDLPKEKAVLDGIALTAARWVIRHQGEIRSLEVIVNMLAAKANHTGDKDELTALFDVMNEVIEHTSPELSSDPDKSDPNRPWRMLNFNFAIVATRTMNKELMVRAFDTLGRNLPQDCPQFFEEGLIQSEKAEYGAEVKPIMTEYFKKWATLH